MDLEYPMLIGNGTCPLTLGGSNSFLVRQFRCGATPRTVWARCPRHFNPEPTCTRNPYYGGLGTFGSSHSSGSVLMGTAVSSAPDTLTVVKSGARGGRNRDQGDWAASNGADQSTGPPTQAPTKVPISSAISGSRVGQPRQFRGPPESGVRCARFRVSSDASISHLRTAVYWGDFGSQLRNGPCASDLSRRRSRRLPYSSNRATHEPHPRGGSRHSSSSSPGRHVPGSVRWGRPPADGG